MLMTTEQAREKFLCEGCRTGESPCSDYEFGGDCVESATGSIRCPKCQGRCWVEESLSQMEEEEVCPYCKTVIDGKKWRR